MDHITCHIEPELVRESLDALVIADFSGTTHELCPSCLRKANGRFWIVRGTTRHGTETDIFADAVLTGRIGRAETVDGVSWSPDDHLVVLAAGVRSTKDPRVVTWHLRVTSQPKGVIGGFKHVAACRVDSLQLSLAPYGPEHLMRARYA
jgi:hypothetical protein